MSNLIYGVGISTKGKYKRSQDGKGTKWYKMWCGMLERCYCPVRHISDPSYKGCSVDPRFHRFQDFMEWVVIQIGFLDCDSHLDKDLLFKGNKIYGPDTCVLLNFDLNMLLTKRNASRGKYPIGVTFHKASNKFRARVRKEGVDVHLGGFMDIESAFKAHKEAKESHMKDMAAKYKDVIDPRAYFALMNYTVSITD
jgi:hypothetical protein